MIKALPLILSVATTAGAQVLFKMYFVQKRFLLVVASVGMFCMAPVMNYLALKDWTLGTVYMATGLTYVLVVVLARLLLSEKVDRQTIYAMALIVAGVVVFNI